MRKSILAVTIIAMALAAILFSKQPQPVAAQQRAGLTPEQVPQLKLKWAFGYPNGVSALSQPTVVSGRVFVGADTGYLYSLDARTGCIYWSFKTQAGVYGQFSGDSRKGCLDWREFGRQYAWVLLTVRIYDFVMAFGPITKRLKEAA